MSVASHRWTAPRIHHAYPPQVHIIDDPVGAHHLARLCDPSTVQPAFNRGIVALYRRLADVVATEQLPTIVQRTPTRMTESSGAALHSPAWSQQTRVVVVDIARAGMLPAHACFDALCELLPPENVRMDHLMMARQSGDDHHVTHAALGSHRIGGDIDGRWLWLPDPMGATGTSLRTAVELYRDQVPGTARRIVAMHLIVTPEYIRRITTECPDVHIYALRVDRGLSPPDVLAATPGQFWDRERGLDDHDYIVPGGGGFGELISNAWI